MSDDAPILLIGATGLIGRAVHRGLLVRGYAVTAVARRAGSLPAEWLVLPDPWTPAALLALLESRRFGAVIHLAAYGTIGSERDSAGLFRLNLSMVDAAIKAAAATQATAFVLAGSSAEYAHLSSATRLSEMSPLETRRLYGASKAAAGIWSLALGRSLALPTAVVRLFHVFGDNERDSRLFPSLVSGLAAGQRVPLSPGSQVRDFLHVNDAADALIAVMDGLRDDPLPGGWLAVNACTGRGTSIASFADMIADTMGVSRTLLGFGDLPLRPDDSARLVGDPTLMLARFGWRARMSLEKGIARSLRGMAVPLPSPQNDSLEVVTKSL